jgi:general nucleoside transport system ATP-binding protein
VHRRIVEQRDQGVAVLIVSAELDEIYALADRIAVMYEGRITGFRPPTVPVEELGLLMAGGPDQDSLTSEVSGSPGSSGPSGSSDSSGSSGSSGPDPAPSAIPGAGQ